MGTFNTAHKFYCDFYTKDVWDEEKGKEKIGVYYTEERLNYIHRFYESLLSSDKMNELGLIYLKHSNLSVRKVVELYNQDKSESKKINENTGKSKIIACANKINNSFSELYYDRKKLEPLELLMSRRAFNKENVELMNVLREAEDQIDKFIDMFDTTHNHKRDKLIIKMPGCAKVREISDEKFDDFMEIVRPYSKREIACVEKCLMQMKDEVGYFNFLMTPGMKLTDKDKERRDSIFRWLGIGLSDEQNEAETTDEIDDTDNTDDVLLDFDVGID